MKAFTYKLSDPLPELHDQHIFEEREARREAWDQQGEHDRDLEHESRINYASWETDNE
jgi:hypothetical protein